MTKANSYGSGNQPKFTIPAPTTYKITFKGIKEGYQIVNSDNTKITDFPATANGYEFNWKITYTDERKQEVEKEVESIRGSIGRGSSDSNQTQDNNQNVSNTSTTQDSEKEESKKSNASKNQSADEAFQEFLDKVSFTENDETWETYTLAFDDSNIYKQLEEWYKEQELFTSGKISKDDYENWQLKYPLSLADDWKIKINNYQKISKNATIKNDPTDQKLNVILKLIVDKFSVCKNMDEVAEAVQDIKDMISK